MKMKKNITSIWDRKLKLDPSSNLQTHYHHWGAADGEHILIFRLVCPNKARIVSFFAPDI